MLTLPNGLQLLNKHYGSFPFDHIESVSKFCKVGELDYIILRVEEQTLWFNAFVQRYGLQQKMANFSSHGNTVFESGLQADSLVSDFVGSIVGKEEWPKEAFETSHQTGSSSKLA